VTFLHPLVLLGLAAGAIPTLLHLLARHEPPDADFPALRYLTEAERRSAHRVRLRHLILLALRTALVLLIVLAAARPLLRTTAGGGHAPTALVVIFDNSPSAGAVVEGRPVLERLREVARGSVNAARPEDHLWLMLADGVARAGERSALLAVIDSAGVAPWRLDLGDAVTRAVQVISDDPLPNREVHVVSDLERSALGSARVEARGTLVLVLAGATLPAPNRGVGRAVVTDGQLAVNVLGTPGTDPGAVTVRLGSTVVTHALAGPGTTLTIPLPVEPPGWWQGDVTLEPDEFRADDQVPFVWHVARESDVHPASDVGPFVTAALAVLETRSGPVVRLGGLPGPGPSVLLPPLEPALVGELDRALAARGSSWRYGQSGSPGVLASRALAELGGVAVAQRYRLERSVSGSDSAILATVNGEPWLVRDGDLVLVGSRLDTAWTDLPRRVAFVPFVDALVNRLVRGETPVEWMEGRPRIEFRVRGLDTVGAKVYGLDPRVSDLTAATAEEARGLGGMVLPAAQFAAASFAGGRRADASGLLLALALVVAGAELGVATLGR